VVNLLPWLMVVATVGGVGYALWMRARRPGQYRGLAAEPPRAAEEAVVPAAVPATERVAELDIAQPPHVA
jgi:hypothetical protein